MCMTLSISFILMYSFPLNRTKTLAFESIARMMPPLVWYKLYPEARKVSSKSVTDPRFSLALCTSKKHFCRPAMPVMLLYPALTCTTPMPYAPCSLYIQPITTYPFPSWYQLLAPAPLESWPQQVVRAALPSRIVRLWPLRALSSRFPATRTMQ